MAKTTLHFAANTLANGRRQEFLIWLHALDTNPILPTILESHIKKFCVL